MAHLDGNVLAGAAQDVFAFEITTASGECLGCGDTARLAEAMVYGQPMGHVVRCRACDNVLLVIVTTPQRQYVTTSGMRWVRSPRRPS